MNTIKKTKNILKFLSRRYLKYDPSLRRIRIEESFLEQKKLLSDVWVQTIFDVGANVGQTTQKYRKLFPKAHVYGFEPFPNVFKTYTTITDGDSMIHRNLLALSDSNGIKTFYTNKSHYTNSLLPIDDSSDVLSGYAKENYINESKINVEADTIDHFCDISNIKKIDILKIDTQGGELLVLKGAENMLKTGKIDIIFTEIAYKAIYKDQPLLKDLENFLIRYGYHTHQAYDINYAKDGSPVDGDVIFIR